MRPFQRAETTNDTSLVMPVAFGCTFAASLLLDYWVAERLFGEIDSGQLKAFLCGMRCWGEAGTLLVVAFGMVIVRPSCRRLTIAILLGCLLCGAAIDLVKPLIGRHRPTEGARPTDASWAAAWRMGAGWNSSFPSGHTASAFCFARGLSHAFPVLRPLTLFAAGGTAVSRVAEKRHYLSDVVAAAFLGWLVGTLLLRYVVATARPSSEVPRRFRRSSFRDSQFAIGEISPVGYRVCASEHEGCAG